MPGQMDEDYFDEKKGLSVEALKDAIGNLQRALALVNSSRYAMPDLIDAAETHRLLKAAAQDTQLTRYNFEKSRWASARTTDEFDAWLQSGSGKDLVQSGAKPC